MNAIDTLVAIIRAPGDIGVGLAHDLVSFRAGDEVVWLVAVLFWAAIGAFLMRLR